MFLLIQQQARLLITAILFLSLSIGIISCSNSANEKSKNIENTTEQDKSPLLLGLLNEEQAKQLIDYYKDAGTDMTGDFFFDNHIVQSEKVISYMLDSIQRINFFHKLDSLLSDTATDSVRIRIMMSLLQSGVEEDEIELPNFTPILTLVKDTGEIVYPVYPLNPFKPLLNWSTFQCPRVKEDGPNNPGIRVSCPDAKKLVSSWKSVDTNAISKQLYLYPPTNPLVKEDRVKYYTFDKFDTDSIGIHYNKLINDGKTCYFYLHLGREDSTGWIPLRNVLHLDEKDISIDTLLSTTASTYFEFSRPCPHYCNNND